MPRAVITLILAAIALATPAVAHADGPLTLVGTQLRFESGSQDAENLVISRQTSTLECGAGASPCIQFANGPQLVSDQNTACVQVIATVVSCNPASFASISLTLNDGDDFVASIDTAGKPVTLDGGPGADHLDSRGGADVILGGPGDDELFDDGDTIGGDDRIDGGEGNDSIFLGRGDDDVIGGDGIDTVELDSGDDRLRLDDVANDGTANETKNIRPSAEIVDGGGGSDNLFGNAAANTLRGGSGNDLIDGAQGADVLDGGVGADELSGGADADRVEYPGAGAQTISLDDARNDGAAGELDNVRADIEDVASGAGNDVVTGSAAPNALDGGAGDDRLDGGAAADTYLGGAGADTLLARDGLQERLECGTEADGGEADTTDVLVGCEAIAVSSALVPDFDRDGVAKPDDCNDDDPLIRPGVVDAFDNGIDEDCSGADSLDLDRDRDGFARPQDCNDGDPRTSPGAVDVPGNAVDEDCRAGAAPFPLLDSAISVTFRFARAFTTFTEIGVRRAQAGSTVELRCSGRGCPFKIKRRAVRRDRATLVLNKPFGRAKLRRGARVEVRVTKAGTIGNLARYTVRPGKAPVRVDRCLRPGSRRAASCSA